MKEEKFYQQAGVAMTCRSYEEYVRMFTLDEKKLAGLNIVDVAAGASSFAAQANTKGCRVTAADPLYGMNPERIEAHGRLEIETSTAKLAGLVDQYRWDYYGSLDNHRANRIQSLQRFLADYREPRRDERYVHALLPELPFAAESFDLTLCSHFLFLYEQQFDYNFHASAVEELLRVTKRGGEVRLYPIVNFRTERYSGLDRLRARLSEGGFNSRLEPSLLPFLANSDKMLVIFK